MCLILKARLLFLDGYLNLPWCRPCAAPWRHRRCGPTDTDEWRDFDVTFNYILIINRAKTAKCRFHVWVTETQLQVFLCRFYSEDLLNWSLFIWQKYTGYVSRLKPKCGAMKSFQMWQEVTIYSLTDLLIRLIIRRFWSFLNLGSIMIQ